MANQVSITLNVRGLRAFASAMGEMGNRAFDRSQRKAVTFIAKDYRKVKKGRVASDIDRPNTFTRNAYDFDGAPRTGPIVSRAFVKTRQSEYLDIVESGGTRRKVGKNRPIGIKPQFQDRFGGAFGAKGIQRRFIDRSARPSGIGANGRPTYKTGDRKYVVLKLQTATGPLSGVFEKRKMGKATTRQRVRAGKSGWRTRMIISFKTQARYQPQLGFGRDARSYSRTRFPALSNRLFNEELTRLLRNRR